MLDRYEGFVTSVKEVLTLFISKYDFALIIISNITQIVFFQRKIAALVRELKEKDSLIEKIEERIVCIENQLEEIKKTRQAEKSGLGS